MNYRDLWHQLAPSHGESEAKAVARMVYEVRYGLSLSDLYAGKDTQLSADDQAELQEIARRLSNHEPVQYVLGQTDFCGRTFLVNEHVLIPRPETAELCQWILSSSISFPSLSPIPVLDIGTGSGCIAITLAASFSDAEVYAWDISPEALEVARTNAVRNSVNVHFEPVDMLSQAPLRWKRLGDVSIIVSNPPYICRQESVAMDSNVLDYEPHTALFVPDNDPLLFYRTIAQYGLSALRDSGWLYFEINPVYANDLRELLHIMSYHDIEIKEDQFGKQRFIRAQR